MMFDDAMTLVMYNIYNWLAIHGAPAWVLDLFIPFLCHTTTRSVGR